MVIIKNMDDKMYEFKNEENLIKPNYYNKNGVDVIEMIRLLRGEQAAKEFCIGNIYKYTTRFDKKNGLEDLSKAMTYLDRLIELERSYAKNQK